MNYERATPIHWQETQLRNQQRLRFAMRSYGVLLALATASFYWLPAFGRWPPPNTAYEHMFAALFFAWGICLYHAADDPNHSQGLIDFTALQGFLHGGVMLLDALTLGSMNEHHSLLHLIGDVPFHLSMGFVLGFLRRFAPQSEVIPLSRQHQGLSVVLFAIVALIVFHAVFLPH